MDELEVESDGFSEPLIEVPSGGGQQEIEGVTEEAFEVVAGQTIVALQVADGGFDGAASAEPFLHGAFVVGTLVFGLRVGHEDLGVADSFGATVAAINDGYSRKAAGEGFSLLEDFRQGVAVVDVVGMRHGRDDEAAGFSQGDGGFGAEFVFLVLLAFGHAVDVRLVETIDFVVVVAFLQEDFSIESEIVTVFVQDFHWQLAFEFAHQSACQSFESARGSHRFLNRAPVAASALGQQAFLGFLAVTTSQLDFLLVGQSPAALDDFAVEFGVGRISHILFLHRRVDDDFLLSTFGAVNADRYG